MATMTITGPHSPRKPSRLRIASEPSISSPLFSPSPTLQRDHSRTLKSQIPSPPQVPPSWTWTCHQCHSSFPLGATRRCLHDGHRFCAGATLDRRSGKLRRHKACGSTFDYVGWKTYNNWRDEAERITRVAATVEVTTPRSFKRKLFGTRNQSVPELSITFEMADEDKENLSPTSPVRNCERQCSFPSECRWNPRPAVEKERSAKSTRDAELRSPTTISTSSPKSPTNDTIDPQLLAQSPPTISTPCTSDNAIVSTPSTPAFTSPSKSIILEQPKNPDRQSTTSFRAPVLDFAAFKARLDRASARRRSREDAASQLPHLKLGVPVLMDVDAISPTTELPRNNSIHVAITGSDERDDEGATEYAGGDVDMKDAWDSVSESSGDSPGSSPIEESADARLARADDFLEREWEADMEQETLGAPDSKASRRWRWTVGGIVPNDLISRTDPAEMREADEEVWSSIVLGDEDITGEQESR